MNGAKDFVRNNSLTLLLFLGATFFFLFQHVQLLSWDFSSYVLNAKCFFYNGAYCETQRPPLASILLAPFLIFGSLGEYLYIILVSLLFLYSSIKISDTLFKNKQEQYYDKMHFRLIFYFFSLSIFTLLIGMKEGTELLALSLLELAFSQILLNKNAGFYMGLAFLSRYSSLIFAPLLLLHPKFKSILKNAASFLLVIFPWFLWNFIEYGNWFTSFIDGYAQNIYLRKNIMPLTLLEILQVTNYFTIIVLLGIIISIYFLFALKGEFWKNNKESLFIFLIASIIIWNYSTIPTKFPRYLFNLTLPIAFFSSLVIIAFFNKIRKHTKVLLSILMIIFIVALSTAITKVVIEKERALPFSKAAQDIKQLGIENCEILSPHWVPVAYYTENVYPLGNNPLQPSIQKGKILLIFNESTIDDTFTLSSISSLPVLYAEQYYTFYALKNISRSCSPKYKYNDPYIANPCKIVKESSPSLLAYLTEKACTLINKRD